MSPLRQVLQPVQRGKCKKFRRESHLASWDEDVSLNLALELDHKEELNAEELMLSNCGAGEDSKGPLDIKGNQTSPSSKKST